MGVLVHGVEKHGHHIICNHNIVMICHVTVAYKQQFREGAEKDFNFEFGLNTPLDLQFLHGTYTIRISVKKRHTKMKHCRCSSGRPHTGNSLACSHISQDASWHLESAASGQEPLLKEQGKH